MLALWARPDLSRARVASFADRLAHLAVLDAADDAWCHTARLTVTTHDAWDFAAEANTYRTVATDWADVVSEAGHALVELARACVAEANAARRLVFDLLTAGDGPHERAPLPPLPRIGPYAAGE